MRRVYLLLALGCGSAHATAAAMPADAVRLTISGPATVVFSHGTQACDELDIPDAPARAIRDADGQVQLFAPHFRNRRLVGRDLLHLAPDCRVVLAGGEQPDPAAFDDRVWIAAPYTQNGLTIFAILHDEFQGHRHPGRCPTGRYLDCWFNALTFAVSNDQGAHFVRAAPAVVASLPYRYDETIGAHRGYFNPSNIVEWDGHLAMFAFATRAGVQRPGNCLLRTDHIEDATSWRGWDGTGFAVRFADPYAGRVDPSLHVCAPVAPDSLRWPVTSLTRHVGSGRFIALMMDAATGIHAASSPDLLRWSAPELVLAASGHGAWRCGEPPPLAYPSLLDPASASRNFDTVGDTAMMFATRFNPAGCRLGMDRDLIRFTVSITSSQAQQIGPEH